jgi:hypothetical protein
MVLILLGAWIAGLKTSFLLLQVGVLAAAALFILPRPDAPVERE